MLPLSDRAHPASFTDQPSNVESDASRCIRCWILTDINVRAGSIAKSSAAMASLRDEGIPTGQGGKEEPSRLFTSTPNSVNTPALVKMRPVSRRGSADARR